METTMDIPSEYRRIIVDEFKYAVKLMRENEHPELKLYYFSSTHGALSRIFNLHCDTQLVFMHFILNNANANINARLNAIKGGDIIVQFPDGYFEKLAECVETLASQIEKDENTYKILEKIAVLTFLTTGNGYYLFQKGMLKIS